MGLMFPTLLLKEEASDVASREEMFQVEFICNRYLDANLG